MGVVWKALDTTLDRDVAIKVLPDAFATDHDRLARFEREAKLLAALNHPNIATIHGLHEADGIRFLAMEFVAGEDLAQPFDSPTSGLGEPNEAAIEGVEDHILQGNAVNAGIHRRRLGRVPGSSGRARLGPRWRGWARLGLRWRGWARSGSHILYATAGHRHDYQCHGPYQGQGR